MFDYNAPENVKARADEIRWRPMALKVTSQYERGLITLWELAEALTEIGQ